MTEERNVLEGAVDIHIHAAPDIFPRCVTALSAAQAAQAAGMAAIVFKSHSTDTAARAETVRDLIGFPAYGGVCLNYPVGGMNPHAVVETARQGGRVVWMPSINARNFIPRSHMAPMLAKAIPKGVQGLVASRNGRLLPPVARILDIIAERGLLLCGGHLEASDTLVLFAEAGRRGIDRMVVNHAEAEYMGFTIEDIRQLAEVGAFIEVTKVHSIAERAELIRAVGAEHCVIATDAGPVVNPPPVDLLRETLTGLSELGFSEEELRYMSVEVPSWLIQLEGHTERPHPSWEAGSGSRS